MKRTLVSALVLLLSLGFSAVEAQKLYKWVDKDGKVSWHDRPPPSGEYRVEERSFDAARPKDKKSLAPVVLYTVPDCATCDLARGYLRSRNVPFTEKNAQSNFEVQKELQEKSGGLSVPTFIVGDRVIKGDLNGLLEALDQAGYPKAEAASAPATGGSDKPPAQ